MAATNHKLLLGMYSFQIKKLNTGDDEPIEINTFLSDAYPDADTKFSDGFANEIISFFDEKSYKNEKNTHGGSLDKQSIATEKRYFDILIDGGITGIQQFLVDNEGKKETISKDKIIGLKFYARFWLPAGSKVAYLFIQKYDSLSLKPLFDSLINDILKNHGYNTVGTGSGLKPTTTQKRMDEFFKKAYIRDITIISKESSHDTGVADAQSVTVKLKNIRNIRTKGRKVPSIEDVGPILKNHGFTLGDREYEITATYEYRVDNKKEEEKTVKLDTSLDSINIIPNIIIPQSCIDDDGYPLFEEMKKFVDDEITQIRLETKM
jgi:hypothetical protein